MKRLLEIMEEVESLEQIQTLVKEKEFGEKVWLTNSDFLKDDAHYRKLISEWESLADDCLIDNNGRPNQSNIAILKEKGYYVGPGEQDSFGWLTAVVSKGVLKYVFG